MVEYNNKEVLSYTHSRFAVLSQYQLAKQQEETGEEDRFESDSEGELSCRSEESESRAIESNAEIDYVLEKRILDAGSVAMFQKLTEWLMSLWKLLINSSKILIDESHCRIRTL